MSMALAGEARRDAVLRALDITPWVRRGPAVAAGRPDAGAAAAPGASMPDAAVAVAPCVVLIPAGSDPRALDLLGRALQAGGAVLARAARVSVGDGKLAGPLPPAGAYLACGEVQAQALGRELSAEAMNAAHIVLADEPARILRGADGKRRLWSALRQVRRALAGVDKD